MLGAMGAWVAACMSTPRVCSSAPSSRQSRPSRSRVGVACSNPARRGKKNWPATGANRLGVGGGGGWRGPWWEEGGYGYEATSSPPTSGR